MRFAALTSFLIVAALGHSQLLTRSPEMEALYQEQCTDDGIYSSHMKNRCMCGFLELAQPAVSNLLSWSGEVSCSDGFASTLDGDYRCKNIDLLSLVSLTELNSIHGNSTDEANDIWGWTSPDGREIAIIGLFSGTAFVDVTDPINYKYLGKLPTRTTKSYWRDLKTFEGFAFIVAECKEHGMQVIDLSQMLNQNISDGPIVFNETVHFSGFGKAHNIFINEDSGFAYVVGSSECQGGLYMINISNPLLPSFGGCYAEDGYIHDVQCVMYNGSDSRYLDREICFACNVDTLTIVDVTNKSQPELLSRTSYPDVFYTHQGWLTDDHDTFIFGDEDDERKSEMKTRTMAMNVQNLLSPVFVGIHFSKTGAIDHNQYIVGNYTYQANYHAGLRILKMNDVVNSVNLVEVASFDVRPEDDNVGFNGAWSSYPYFPSGNIIVSSVERGLFVLRPDLLSTAACPGSSTCSYFFGRSKGLTMYRRRGFICSTRCVAESNIERYSRRGWKCGSCR